MVVKSPPRKALKFIDNQIYQTAEAKKFLSTKLIVGIHFNKCEEAVVNNKDSAVALLLYNSSQNILTRAGEYQAFHKLNYLKYLWNNDDKSVTEDQIKKTGQFIADHNLRLVVYAVSSMFSDQEIENNHSRISDALSCLWSSINCFNVGLGNKFSTYAIWAMRKSLYRIQKKSAPTIQLDLSTIKKCYEVDLDTDIDASIELLKLETAIRKLNQRERSIIKSYFDLDHTGHESTLAELGNRFKITKERIRQIKISALGKLKQMMETN